MDHPNHITTKVLPEFIQLLTYYRRKISYLKTQDAAASDTVALIDATRSEFDDISPSEARLAICLQQLISNLQNLAGSEFTGIPGDLLEELNLFQLRHGLEQNKKTT
ncbi:MAG: hypothetical protein R2824_14735 [Saprospiraceae bacterium]|nr:hypothetical protein [Lewinella sp.]